MRRALLLVDDDPTVRRLLSLTLPMQDYEILESDGPDAVELARRGRPDLVFLDWRLPGARGEDVLRELKAERGELPVIVLTAEHAQRERETALALGADLFLTKPFSPLELIGAVERLLGTEPP
jgi:DNA-binding response OmpR family regulator